MNIKHHISAAIMTSAALISLAACNKTEGASVPDAPKANAAEISALAKADDQLAAHIFPQLLTQAGPNANIVISPVSLSQAIGMAYLGAGGETKAQMANVLGWNGVADPARAARGYANSLTQSGDATVTLAIANQLWASNALPIKPAYTDAVALNYGVRPKTVDFTNGQAAAGAINGWASENTKGHIKQIVDAEQVSADTLMVLTNAVYFLGRWSQIFHADAMPHPFTRGDGSKMPIAQMEQTGYFRFAEVGGWKAVALPYGDNQRFQMELMLPPQGQLLNGAGWYQPERLESLRQSLNKAQADEVKVRIPRFMVDYSKSMNDAFKAAGMQDAFSVDKADFKAMGEFEGKNVFINMIAHATYLKVDEEGTVAAAVTAVGVDAAAAAPEPKIPPEFIADRPFLLAIRDTKTGALLFFGRISDPEEAPVAVRG